MDIGLTAAVHMGFSAALSTITAVALGCFVLAKNSRSNLYQIFFVYSLAIGFWSALLALRIFIENPALHAFTGTPLGLLALLIPVLFVHFVSEFLDDRKRRLNQVSLEAPCILGGLFIFLLYHGRFVSAAP